MGRYTLFTLKHDAVVRGIIDKIRREILKYYYIEFEREFSISREMTRALREKDWETKWCPYPSDEKKEFCYLNEGGFAVAMLCRLKKDGDAITFGKKLRGSNPIPALCEPDSIRRRFEDTSLRIEIDENNVGYLCDPEGKKISFAPNVIHAVDSEEELLEHLGVYFPEEKFELK